jgi:hypothetical protein
VGGTLCLTTSSAMQIDCAVAEANPGPFPVGTGIVPVPTATSTAASACRIASSPRHAGVWHSPGADRGGRPRQARRTHLPEKTSPCCPGLICSARSPSGTPVMSWRGACSPDGKSGWPILVTKGDPPALPGRPQKSDNSGSSCVEPWRLPTELRASN